MKQFAQLTIRNRLAVVAVLAALAVLLSPTTSRSDDTKPSPPAQSGATTNSPSASAPKSPRPVLSGAELYSMHCARCHPERYPNERVSAQWKTIILHMRVRANLPAAQANAILKYMQENSGY